MPSIITEKTAELYTQLGIAGAVLFILLVFVFLLFMLVNKLTKNFKDSIEKVTTADSNFQTKSIDKLCDKIDALITSQNTYTQKLNTVLLSNDKDQEATMKSLEMLQNTVTDIQRRVVRIDDRTYGCTYNKKLKGDDDHENS